MVSNELLEFLHKIGKLASDLLCATIYYEVFKENNQEFYGIRADLKVGFDPSDLESFLKEVDSEVPSYDINGILWFVDGTWACRQEYEGQYFWSYRQMPQIPDHLKGGVS